jgi:hypothetical protein
MIKHTYALFWIIALLVQGVRLYIDHDRPALGRLRLWVALAGGAAASALLSVVVLGFVLARAFPEAGFLERVALQLKYLVFEAHDPTPEPLWVYLRNLPAFGPLAALLIVPGLWMSFRGERVQRVVAASWILAVVVMHVIELRQVRYLSYVAPATAFLIVPPLRRLLRRRTGRTFAGLLILAGWLPGHAYSVGIESTRVFSRFYRESEASAFLAPLEARGTLRKPLFIHGEMLSFAPPWTPALVGDLYHSLFHLGAHHVQYLHGYAPDEVVSLDTETLRTLERWPPTSMLIAVDAEPLLNPRGWKRQETERKHELAQAILRASEVRIWRNADGSLLAEGRDPVIARVERSGASWAVTLATPALVPVGRDVLLARADLPDRDTPLHARVIRPGRWAILDLTDLPALTAEDPLVLRFLVPIRVHRNER